MTSSSDHDGFRVAVNRRSGSADPDVIDLICDRLATGADVERYETAEPADLDGAFAQLDGRALVVIGGDGSVHAALQRARVTGNLDRVVFGLVPTGTGNDLARTLGLPLDPDDAAAALLTASARTLDLAVDDRDEVVVNAVHAGIGADAAERAQPMKDQVGAVAYPVGAVAAGVTTQGWAVTVTVDGVELVPPRSDGRALMVAIGNGCTIGGGTSICPSATLDDGVLDVVVSHATGPAARAAYGAALVRGDHASRDDVATARGTEVTIQGEPIPYNIDGEVTGERERATFRIRPSAWRILAP